MRENGESKKGNIGRLITYDFLVIIMSYFLAL